ncbi:MAG: hypothetical protein K5Q00_03170 [Gammaproteobacteria bacterium]|nr:hypothetical protein [Gammaproteobacteria bacterium]
MITKDNIFITLSSTNNDDSSFYLKPRGASNAPIKLHPDAYQAITQAASKLKSLSPGRYRLVVTRGYVHWGLWRRVKGKLGKLIFSTIFPQERYQRHGIFGANGHDDGLSVDVTVYDVQQKKFLKFLTWRSVFISKEGANKLLEAYSEPTRLLNDAMIYAGFQDHDDPRESLQAHFRWISKPELA